MMRGSRWVLVGAGLLAAMAVGCGASRGTKLMAASVGRTGCPAADVAVFGYVSETRTWGALCNARFYQCVDVAGLACHPQAAETLDPELALRAEALLQVPPEHRAAFATHSLLADDWPVFARKVAVLKAAPVGRHEADALLEAVEALPPKLDPADDVALVKCHGRWAKVQLRVRGSGGERRVWISPIKDCDEAVAARLAPHYLARKKPYTYIVGLASVKPIERPAGAQAKAAAEAPEPEKAAAKAEAKAPAAAQPETDGGPLRAWLDEHGATITACTGGQPAAVRLVRAASGEVTVSLHGPLAGSAEEGCVRSALPARRFESGPAELIHVVQPPPAPTPAAPTPSG